MSESPIITFIRGTTLLAVLIALPGIAVCWNLLPTDLWREFVPGQSAPNFEKTHAFRNDTDRLTEHVSVFAPKSVVSVLPEMPALSENHALPDMRTAPQEVRAPIAPPQAMHPTAVQQVPAVRQVSWESSHAVPTQGFESLELRLKALGATYYRLEKWGNRGELFRFSCFVAPSGNLSDGSHTYEKHFQTIGSDVVTVMQTVIADIEQWKNVR